MKNRRQNECIANPSPQETYIDSPVQAQRSSG